jgi:hypothetical protein
MEALSQATRLAQKVALRCPSKPGVGAPRKQRAVELDISGSRRNESFMYLMIAALY